MPTQKAIKQSKLPDEGEEFVLGFGGSAWSSPNVDSDKFWEILQNPHIRENLEKHRSLVFCDYPEIHVYKINENAEEDEEEDLQLSKELTNVAMQVNLYSAMQKAYIDVYSWGPCIINPVWAMQEGKRTLQKLRRLPPESFGTCPMARLGQPAHLLLGGIVQNPDTKEIEFWQTDSLGRTTQLKNVVCITDPATPGVGGTSKLFPISPVITMLDFCSQAQMQKVNRIGAPILFIRFTSPPTKAPSGGVDDITYAKLVLQNWGKNTAYILRPNMELCQLDFQDNQTALDTMKYLEQYINNFFTPSTFIKKAGEGSLGSTGGAEASLFRQWISGQHRWIEEQFEKILQEYLDSNAYEGYRAEIDIPLPEEDRTLAMLEEAKIGSGAMGGMPTLSRNEVRKRLGEAELSEEELDKIVEEWKQEPPPGLAPFGAKPPVSPTGESPEKSEEAPLEPDEGNPEAFQEPADKPQVTEGVKESRDVLEKGLEELYIKHVNNLIKIARKEAEAKKDEQGPQQP